MRAAGILTVTVTRRLHVDVGELTADWTDEQCAALIDGRRRPWKRLHRALRDRVRDVIGDPGGAGVTVERRDIRLVPSAEERAA